MGLLTLEERSKLKELILKLPNIEEKAVRNSLLNDLPPEIRRPISFSDIHPVHIENIITTIDGESAQRIDGSWPIILFIKKAIADYDGGVVTAKLQSLLDTAQSRAVALSKQPDPISPPSITVEPATLSDEPSVQAEADDSSTPTSDEPASPPLISEVLKPIYELQRVVKGQCERLARIQTILTHNPSHYRLRKIDRSQTLRDIVLVRLRENIKYDNRVFAIHKIDEAQSWLNEARVEADRASKALDRCFHAIDALNISAAQEAIDIAYKECKKLNHRLEIFLEEYGVERDRQSAEDSDTNPRSHDGSRYHDIYSPYEIAMDRLLLQLRDTHERYSDALTYQQRLNETIAKSRLIGDTEMVRAERTAIIMQLNNLASSTLGISFNDLMI